MTEEVEPFVEHPKVQVAVGARDAGGGKRQEVVHLEAVDDLHLRAGVLEGQCEVVTNESGAADECDLSVFQRWVHGWDSWRIRGTTLTMWLIDSSSTCGATGSEIWASLMRCALGQRVASYLYLDW